MQRDPCPPRTCTTSNNRAYRRIFVYCGACLHPKHSEPCKTIGASLNDRLRDKQRILTVAHMFKNFLHASTAVRGATVSISGRSRPSMRPKVTLPSGLFFGSAADISFRCFSYCLCPAEVMASFPAMHSHTGGVCAAE